MDTILYFYLKRNHNALSVEESPIPTGTHHHLQPCSLERIKQEEYILIRIGVERSWLEGLGLPQALRLFDENVVGQAMAESGVSSSSERREDTPKRRKSYWQSRREKKIIRELIRVREEEKRKLLNKLEELWQFISPLVDAPLESYLVYEEPLKRKLFHLLWQKYCSFPEFDNYMQDKWAELLYQKVKHPNFLVLGYAMGLPYFLWQQGDRMKGLRWILPNHLYKEEIRQFEEDFLYEFGLAIDIQVLADAKEYRKEPLKSRVPVNVLDFSGEEKLQFAELAEESIWLDMASSEEKRRRIEAGKQSISYFSLKKQWKQSKKESIFLDTTDKNGYNT